jgi:ribokinase
MGRLAARSKRHFVMKKAVAIGYASMDYPAVLDGYFQPDRTVLIKQRPTDSFPRPGGSSLYVARPLAATACKTAIITWVGDDGAGELFHSYASRDGIDTSGIAVVGSGATPVCFLLYQQDGSCGCCFDPGFLGKEFLSKEQAELIKAADLVCITVGPPDIGMQVMMELVSDDAAVAWVAKNDPKSYPERLRLMLGERADYIFCNVSERGWIDSALLNRKRPRPLIVETNSAEPVNVEWGRRIDHLDVPRLSFNDASGAGDTLAGGCLAAIVEGETDAIQIAAAGIAAAARLLRQRSKEDET